MPPRPTTDYVYNSAEMLADPEAAFEQIRAHGDVVWCPSVKCWLVVSKEAAISALKNDDLQVYDLSAALHSIANRSGEVLDDLIRICDWIPFLSDGDRHQQLRSLFARVLADIRDDYLVAIESASLRLLANMQNKGGGDFAKDYGDRLHVEAIGALAGFNETDVSWIARNSSSQGGVDFAASLNEMKEANQRVTGLLDLIGRQVSNASDSPFFDKIGRHLTAVGITNNHSNCVECLTALTLLGRDTLSGTLTLGLAYLLDHNNGVLVSNDWNKLTNMEDEIIRLSSTVQIVNRTATQPVKLGGIDIGTGETILIFLPAANRDPANFPCPHAHSAENGDHIAFGASRHLCVGMPVSRNVINISLQHLATLDYIESLPGRTLGETKNTRKYDALPIQMKK